MSDGKDLTDGNLFSNMIKFCLPLLITNILNSIYNIVDGIWVGQLLGYSGLSAITNCWPILLGAYAVLAGVTVTTTIMVSQCFTGDKKEKIKDIITPLYAISALTGIITTLVFILSGNFWLNLFNTPNEVLLDTKNYVTIYLMGFVFNFMGFSFISGIRAIGDSKTPLKILAITEISNIILDPIFIKLGFGIKGAAIATVLSMILSFLLGFLYIRKNQLLKFDLKYLKIKKDFLKRVAVLGTPIVIQEITTVFTVILEVNLSNSYGVQGGSTYGIVSRFQEVVWILGNTINELITVVIGQFIGKNEFNKVKDVMINGGKLIIIPILIIASIVICGSRLFAKIFTTNEEVINLTVYYLHIVGIGYTTIPLYQLLYGMVLGTGNTRFSFIGNTMSTVLEIIIVLYLNKITGNVFFSLGIGITMWYVVGIVLFFIYYYSKCWYKEKVS